MKNEPRPPLRVIYRDDDLLVVDKPSGIAVHAGWERERPTLVELVRRTLDASEASPLHRLDRATSGVILFALHSEAASRFSALIRDGHLSKTYLALVRGTVREKVDVDHPIPRRAGGPRVPARTVVTRLATAPTEPRETSLVEARPLTGRLHQVRRHLKHISHPIIGDSAYGKGVLNRAFCAQYQLCRLALHALEVSVPLHDGRIETFRASLPPDLSDPLAAMGYDITPFQELPARARASGRPDGQCRRHEG